jgi:tetratricopeptide (TPR) repeat protein
LGIVYGRLRRHAEAISCLQDSLTIRQKLGDQYGEAETLRDLGDALQAVGHHQQGKAAWQQALAICEALHLPQADELRSRLVG